MSSVMMMTLMDTDGESEDEDGFSQLFVTDVMLEAVVEETNLFA